MKCMISGFHQIPMADGDIPKTATITPFGMFKFLRMPFGLKNVAQAFQRLMDGILCEVNFAFVYLDDILIAGPDEEAHKDHLRQLFRLLSTHRVFINRKKCKFGCSEVPYLGHLVRTDGIRPNTDRVQAIREFRP